MADADNPKRLTIKKYPNRRFYDTGHSRHLTLAEMQDLIREGYDLTITDSKTGDDITHVVLTQIILERDSEKLGLFPANILHQMIRTQQQFLGGVLEQFFREAIDAQRASTERWTRFLQNTLGSPSQAATNPLDWTRQFWSSFAPSRAPDANSAAKSARAHTANSAADESESSSVPPQAATTSGEVDELRRQIAELAARLDRLSK